MPNHCGPKRRGFTLVELLLTMATIAILSALSAPLFRQMQTGNDLDLAALAAIQNLRRAQLLATSGKNDSPWGVAFVPGAITLYQGSSFGARAPAWDETTALPSSLTLAGSDISFAKLTGEPVNGAAAVTFVSASGGGRTVSVNAKGAVSN